MEKITKKFIEEKLFDKNGEISPVARLYNITAEEIYLIYHDTEPSICFNKKCNNKTKFLGFKKGYSKYCSRKCAGTCEIKIAKEKATSLKNNSKAITVRKSKETLLKKYNVTNAYNIDFVEKKRLKVITTTDEWKEKRKQTNLKKFGHVSYAGSDDYYKNFNNIITKTNHTNLDKYGTQWVFQSDIIKEKIKQTNLIKYGKEFYSGSDHYYMNLNNILDKIKNTKFNKYGDEYYNNIEKIINTNLERYGVQCVLSLPDIREKSRQTSLLKYGNPLYNNIDQIKRTNLERYGVEWVLTLPEMIEKSRQTNLLKYGKTNYSGSDKYYLNLDSKIEKERQTKLLNGTIIPNELLEPFDLYKRNVWRITNKQPLFLLKNIDKRGRNQYHLDHKISIYYGFINDIDYNYIGNIDNLQMLPEKMNLSKGKNCWSLII